MLLYSVHCLENRFLLATELRLAVTHAPTRAASNTYIVTTLTLTGDAAIP